MNAEDRAFGSLIYFLPDYPLITTTFVDREVSELRRLGASIEIIASRRPPESTPLSDAQKQIRDTVTYLRPIRPLTFVQSQFYYLLTRPVVVCRYFSLTLRKRFPTLKDRLLNVLHVARGVYAAYMYRKHTIHEIHIHFAFGNAVSGIVMAALLDRTYTMSIHAGTDVFAHPVLLKEKIQGARRVATCTSYNKTHLDALAGYDQRTSKIHFIPHGLILDDYRASDDRKTRETPPLIVSVGSLTGRKGFGHLLSACRILKNHGVRFRCEIVGDGPLHAHLANLIRTLELEDTVALLGAKSHSFVKSLYDKADVFALTCVQSSTGDMDGIPNVVAEAMAMSLPVVSSQISGVPEIVMHNETGFLTAPGDEEAIARYLEQLIADPALGRRMGAAGSARIRAVFDVRQNTRQFAEALWPELTQRLGTRQ